MLMVQRSIQCRPRARALRFEIGLCLFTLVACTSSDSARFSTEDCGVEDGESCPDLVVANTRPFTGGVYLQGALAEGTCGTDALQRFWPALATAYFSGFDCYANWYRFRRSDHTIFYQATFSGIRQNNDINDTVIATPPCGKFVGEDFDFDAAGTLYYQCGDVVLRGDGVVVAKQVSSFVATLDDGRVIATLGEVNRGEFVVFDRSGHELSRLSPPAEIADAVVPLPRATTVDGNRGYVAFRHRRWSDKHEIVVFVLDEGSRWSRVRRAEVPGFGGLVLALSDGTVFVREHDPTGPSNDDERIIAFLPDGTSQIMWREADHVQIRAFTGQEMLIGPP
jgi:hypothetical protein